MDEIKKLLEEQGRAFEEFKKDNDKQIGELKSKGAPDPLGEAKLQKINAELDRLEKEHKTRVDELERKLNRASLGGQTEDTESAKKAGEAKAAFFAAMRRGADRVSSDEQKALVLSSDTTGGYLAAPDFVAEIIKAEVLFSPMRPLVTVRQTSSPEVQIPKRTGTASASWMGESQTRAETTNPTWGQLKIPMGELYAETRVSWADLEDAAFNLEQLLTDEFAEQFGVAEGAAIINGNGLNKPLGFLDANAAGPGVPIAYTASGQAATIAGAAAGAAGQADPLIDLCHTLKTAYARNGTWCLNRDSIGKIRKLKDTTGQYLWQPGVGQSGTLGQGLAPTILNAPYCECPDMPNEGANAFPIAFGDLKRAIVLVDRIQVSVTRDALTAANVGQVKFFARRRLGAQVVLGEAMRLLKCSAA